VVIPYDAIIENEENMMVVNFLRKLGGYIQPDLGGQHHRILQLSEKEKKRNF
jgi:hypothetical protein